MNYSICAIAACCVGAVAFGQASFVTVSTPLTGSQRVGVKDMNQAGTALLVEKITPGQFGPGAAAYSVARPDGSLVQLYSGSQVSEGYAISEDGLAYWSTAYQIGGAIRRTTGQTSIQEFTQGVPFDVTGDERLVVGTYAESPPGVDTYTGFRWDRQAGSFTSLAPVAGKPSSFPYALSGDGSIIVGCSCVSNSQPYVPAKWTVGASVALPFAAGTNTAIAMAVANTGDAVGYSWTDPGVAEHKATYWPAAGGAQLLPMAASATGRAVSVSANGRIAAGYETVAGADTAVIWIDGVRYDLRQNLTDRGVPGMSGYVLRRAMRVSADGNVVSGHGQTTAGASFVFFATLGTSAPACAADLGTAGGMPGSDGHLDNNDFIAFIGHFFASDPRADLGVAGGAHGSDGAFDNNDFIAFITLFFNGCS